MKHLLLPLVTLLTTGIVSAQNCPAGIPSAGNPMCIPPDLEHSPHYQGKTNVPRWKDRWGAIAFDAVNVVYGTSASMMTKQMAIGQAIGNCRSKGGAECRQELVYRNKCGVIAWGYDFVTSAGAGSVREASEAAIQACSRESLGCEIVYANCSMAELE